MSDMIRVPANQSDNGAGLSTSSDATPCEGCVSCYSIAVKRHCDQGTSYNKMGGGHLIRGLLIILEG